VIRIEETEVKMGKIGKAASSSPKKNHEPQVAYKATSTKTKSKGMYRKSFNTNEATDLSKIVLPRKKWTQAPGSETDSRESDVEKCEGRG
jgi:hypothetical protein